MRNFKMYIGLTTQYNHHLYPEFVMQQVGKLFNNFTVYNTIGYYNGEQEHSLVFECFNTDFDENSICRLSKELNQECIGIYDLNNNEFTLYYAKDYEEYFDFHWQFKKQN